MRQILGRTAALYHPRLTLFRTLTSQPFIISWIIIDIFCHSLTLFTPTRSGPNSIVYRIWVIYPTAVDVTFDRHNICKKVFKISAIFNLISNTKKGTNHL